MTTKPRILMVRATGLEQAQPEVTLVNFLQSHGFDITVAILYDTGPMVPGMDETVRYVRLQCGLISGKTNVFRRINAAMRVRSLFKCEQFDVLYVIDSWTLAAVLLATFGRFRWRNTGLVYHTFDWLEPGQVYPLHLWIERMACRTADLVVNIDRARGRLQRTLYRLSTTPLWVQNCLPRETPLLPCDPSLRRELLGGKDVADACLMVYPTAVSNEDSAERLTANLIRAFAQLPERYRLATFYNEGVEYRKCLELTAAHGLKERVVYLSPVPFAQLRAYLACADIGAVLYDDRYSSGYFMANADKLYVLVATGIPFVASDYPNLASITYQFGLGVCCDARDPKALAGAIRELAEGSPPLTNRKSHVRSMFESDLNFEPHGQRLAEALQRIASDRVPAK